MGNRATITTKDGVNKFGLYVHWNGGRDTVEAVLNYLVTQDITFETELDFLREVKEVYKFAFGNKYDINIWEQCDLDNYDNGVFILDKDKVQIIGRMYAPTTEQNEYDLLEMTEYIEEKMKERNFIKEQYLESVYNKIKQWSFKYKIDYDKNKILVEDQYKKFDKENSNKPRYKKIQQEMKEMYGGDYIEFKTGDFGGEW